MEVPRLPLGLVREDAPGRTVPAMTRRLWWCLPNAGNCGNRTLFALIVPPYEAIVSLYESGGLAFGLRPGPGLAVDLGRIAFLVRGVR